MVGWAGPPLPGEGVWVAPGADQVARAAVLAGAAGGWGRGGARAWGSASSPRRGRGSLCPR